MIDDHYVDVLSSDDVSCGDGGNKCCWCLLVWLLILLVSGNLCQLANYKGQILNYL